MANKVDRVYWIKHLAEKWKQHWIEEQDKKSTVFGIGMLQENGTWDTKFGIHTDLRATCEFAKQLSEKTDRLVAVYKSHYFDFTQPFENYDIQVVFWNGESHTPPETTKDTANIFIKEGLDTDYISTQEKPKEDL